MLLEITPNFLPEYELMDSGNFEKLERFGEFVLRRPEPQAIWEKTLTEADWQKLSHAVFERKSEKDAEAGNWKYLKKMPDRWMVKYQGAVQFKMRLACTSFKHVGIFPEQANNWEYISTKVQHLKSLGIEKPRILNLFAYTGGASLAACAAGAEVTHVDSVKQVITWSRENMESSGLDGIRWMVDDAFKFVQKDVRRNKTYHGILLDPPAYGRGPDGEKWQLEKQLNELLGMCANILEPQNAFVLLNLYSMGFSAIIANNLLLQHFKNIKSEYGEFYLNDKWNKRLPLGIFARGER